MFYKRILLFLILIITIFNFIGCIQPDSDTKIKKISMQYLKDKYNEEFEFQKVNSSWNEGDCFWRYEVIFIPKNNPDMTVKVRSKEGIKDISDAYKKEKWNAPIDELMKNLIESKFGQSTNFSVNIYTNKEIEDKYSVNDDPLDIIKKEANYRKGVSPSKQSVQPIYETIAAEIPIDENINEDDMVENLLIVMKYYNDLQLYFNLGLTFGKRYINGENNINNNGTFKEEFSRIEIGSNTIAEKNSIIKCIKYYKNGVLSK